MFLSKHLYSFFSWDPRDAYYPTDIHYGTDFYGNDDFKGYDGISVDLGFYVGKQKGVTKGYLKGWGYGIFDVNSDGPLISAGGGLGADAEFRNREKYLGPYFPNYDNFIGSGKIGGIDLDLEVVSVGAQWWTGFGDGPGGVAWKGHVITAGTGFGAKVFEGQKTTTTLRYPKKSSKMKLREKMWNNDSKIEDESTAAPIFK